MYLKGLKQNGKTAINLHLFEFRFLLLSKYMIPNSYK